MKTNTYTKVKHLLLDPLPKHERKLYKALWSEWKELFYQHAPDTAATLEERKAVAKHALLNFVTSISQPDVEGGSLVLPEFALAFEATLALRLMMEKDAPLAPMPDDRVHIVADDADTSSELSPPSDTPIESAPLEHSASLHERAYCKRSCKASCQRRCKSYAKRYRKLKNKSAKKPRYEQSNRSKIKLSPAS